MDLTELSMLLETLEAKEVSQEEFLSAVHKAKSMTTLDNEQQLILYALYKQATVGNVNVPKPDKTDIAGSYKWKSWKQFENFPQKNAAIAYVYVVTQLLSGTAFLKKDSSSSDAADPGNSDEHNGMGAIVSTLFYEYDQSLSWSDSEALFKAVVEDDLDKLKECIETGADVNAVSEEGMTPLHFAADRGYDRIAQYLLERLARVDAADSSGQTPLMYAVSCENTTVVNTLLKAGADVSIRNNEGLDVLSFEDVTPEIMRLLTA